MNRNPSFLNNRVVTGAIIALALFLIIIPAYTWPLWTLIFLTLIALAMSLELHNALSRIFRPLSVMLALASTATLLAPAVAWLTYGDGYKGWQFIPLSMLPPNAISATWQLDYLRLVGSGALCYLILFMLLLIASCTYTVLRYGPERLPQTAAATSAGLYIAFPFMCLHLMLFAVPNGYRWLFPAVFLPLVADTAAYYGGRFLGKHPFFPKLSPKKTREGAVIGILAGVLAALLYFVIFLSGPQEPFHPTGGALAFGIVGGLLISLAGEAGDLYASALKRWVGIKDFGHSLPGHGGFLDRFDSVLFSAPMTFFVMLAYYHF